MWNGPRRAWNRSYFAKINFPMVVNFDGTFKNELMLFYFIEDYLSYVTQRNAKTLLWISLVIRQKGESQNGCFKKTSMPNFPKNEHFLPLIRTRRCAYQGLRNVVFWKIWCALYSWNTRFEIRPFALLPTISLAEVRRLDQAENIFHLKRDVLLWIV